MIEAEKAQPLVCESRGGGFLSAPWNLHYPLNKVTDFMDSGFTLASAKTRSMVFWSGALQQQIAWLFFSSM